MGYEDKIVKRLKDTLHRFTLKLIGLFLLIAVVVGGLAGYILYENPLSGIKDPNTDKGTVWKVSLIGSAVGLLSGFLAYYANLI